jgi:hypothetical protein
MCLDITPPFFHMAPKVVKARVITYDEIFQAVAVEADVIAPEAVFGSRL